MVVKVNVKLPILPTLFIHFVQGRLGELRSGCLGLEGLRAVKRMQIKLMFQALALPHSK